MKQLLLRLKRFCGYIAGFVFFISGILKLMDPVGASLVMKEYFQFLHIVFMNFAAIPAGVGFALAETLVGAALITGVWRRIIAPAAIVLQGLFTLLTSALVIFKPEMDCGCFGEAIHLSHTQTFIKNIILLALLLIYYIPKKHLGETKAKKYVSFGLVSASAAAFCLYSILYIPMADFTALKPGTRVNNLNSTTENPYEATFIYEKDGMQQEFSLESLPDSTWNFISSITKEQSPADTKSATISIYNKEGEYADSLLTDGRVMIVSIYKNNASDQTINDTEELLNEAKNKGFYPLLLTSSLEIDSPYHFFCDYKTLITLNRSSGGATYIDNGLIIRKWSKRTLPTPEELATISKEDSTDTFIGRDTRTNLAFQGFLLYVFAVMLLL